MQQASTQASWSALADSRWLGALTVLLSGVLLHSMNVLMVATALPSIVADIGGAALMSWPTTAYLGSSIVAATCTGLVTARLGARRTYFAGGIVFALGIALCGLAPDMNAIVAGRFVQGLGGGFLSATAYVLVRNTFPEPLWTRVFALLAGMWSVSVLIGPLLGGAFADEGRWRGAFAAVAVLGGFVAVLALFVLPARERAPAGSARVPAGRVALVCGAIAVLSAAAVVEVAWQRAALLAAALAALAGTLHIDRRAAGGSLLPSDAFSLTSGTGLGLWVALCVSVAFAPLQVYVPAFLQRLRDFEPITAGYVVAAASLAWTLAALAVSGFTRHWPGRLIAAGPVIMAAGLLGMALVIAEGSNAAVILSVALVGAGIGSCWAFTAQRVMSAALPGDEDSAASAVATVQQIGVALGAALAGLVANGAGFDSMHAEGVANAAFSVPLPFVAVAMLGGVAGLRLATLGHRAATGSP